MSRLMLVLCVQPILAASAFAACPSSLPTTNLLRCLATENAANQARLDALEAWRAEVEGVMTVDLVDQTVTFSGVNLHIVNGLGSTEAQATDGTTAVPLGNLVIGYDEADGVAVRTANHSLILGRYNSYSGIGLLVHGVSHDVSGDYAATLGGAGNVVNTEKSVAIGGFGNTAGSTPDCVGAGERAVVIGGFENGASGDDAVAAGGWETCATGRAAVGVGGSQNEASGAHAVTLGGESNHASGHVAAALGGYLGEASGDWSTTLGGRSATADDAEEIAP